MTLTILLFRVAIAAIFLTLITKYVFKKDINWITSYLQNFCGALFVFSGKVKADDPLGTAYKMVDYFDQFEAVFAETWLSFIAPLFPLLSEYSIGFSVLVIIFEIVLGAMLIIGHKPKLTAWAFFILVLFFTALTGFTYLTGYVPGDVNFFDFGGWGAYDATNMKVTDCGCFGDYIKLEPKTSFFKDVFLLFPAVYFLIATKSLHEWFSHNVRSILVSVITVGLLIYCLSNYIWDIPRVDYRPFKKTVNIGEIMQLEQDALASVQITDYKVTNKSTGETKTIPYATYLSSFKDYPTTDWELEQVSSEPTIATTKISDFDITTPDYVPLNGEILESDDPVLLIFAYELYGTGSPASRVVNDTIYSRDTLLREDGTTFIDRNIKEVRSRTEPYIDYHWKDYYAERYRDIVIPFAEEAKASGVKVFAVISGADDAQIKDFRKDVGLDAVYGIADDKLIKTIVRSNPGIVILKKGKILNKWHYKKLPKFKEIEESFLQ
ncbi:MAG: hypothetical protein ACI9FN_000564 [Saprospiraceae bacterium]|jgi:hypothetical protein